MDPNETLDTIRSLMTIYRNDGDWDMSETHMLIEYVENLDEWMSHGGFLPDAWNVKTAFDLRQ